MQPRLLTAGAIAAALLVLPITACGGDDGGGNGGGGNGGGADADLVVHALDTLKFDKSDYEVPGDDIEVAYINDGSIVHTLLVEGQSGFKLEVDRKGETDSGSVNLSPGTYTIFCDVPAHRAGGMEATLVVTPATAS